MPHKRFARFLRQVQERCTGTGGGSVNDFAKMLGVLPSHLSRAMGTNSRPFDLDGLFNLADVSGEPAEIVLRAAGKDKLVDSIRRHFGPPQPPPMHTARAMNMLKLWEEIEASGVDDSEGLAVALWVLERTLAAVRQRQSTRRVTPKATEGHRVTRHRSRAV